MLSTAQHEPDVPSPLATSDAAINGNAFIVGYVCKSYS
jgi:hypothetical protein